MPARPLALGLRGPNRVAIGRVRRMVAALRRLGGNLWMVDHAYTGAFVDIAGTQPVTAYADLLGLGTDRLGVLGPNVFSDATSCTFAGESVRVSSGVYRIYSSAGVYSAVSISGGLQQNKTYRLRFYQDNAIAGALAIDGPVGSVVPVVAGGVGWKECIVTMTSVVSLTIKRSSAATDIQISNVLIQELTGSHATQSAVASKPSVQRVPKRLGPELSAYASGFASTAGIRGIGATVGISANELVITSTSVDGSDRGEIPINGLTVGRTYSATVVARRGAQGANQQIQQWTIGSISATGIDSTTAWAYKFTFVATAESGLARVYSQAVSGAVGDSAVVTSLSIGEVLEWANVISFDGNNDFLSAGVTPGNEGFVAVGVRHSTAVTCYPLAAGGLIDSMAGMNLRLINGVTPQILVCDGTLRQVLQADANVPLGTPFVYSGGWNSTDLLLGVDATEKVAARTRNPTAAVATTIGAADGTGAGVVNGPLYAVCRSPVFPDAATRKIIINGLAALQGRGPL